MSRRVFGSVHLSGYIVVFINNFQLFISASCSVLDYQ